MFIKEFIGNTQVDMKARTVVSVIATDSLDRDNEVVLPSGINIKDFMKNPIVLFQHEQTVPIGKCVEMAVEAGNITTKTFFAERPETHEGEWFPDTILSLFDQGILRGFSIGFQADPKHIRCSKKDKATWPGVNKVYARTLLTEYSVVSVPSNGEALAKSFKSFIKETPVEEAPPAEEVPEQVEAADETKEMMTNLMKMMADMTEKFARLETKQQEQDEEVYPDFEDYDQETADEEGASLYDQLLADEQENEKPVVAKKAISLFITQDEIRKPAPTPLLDLDKAVIAKRLGKIYA